MEVLPSALLIILCIGPSARWCADRCRYPTVRSVACNNFGFVVVAMGITREVGRSLREFLKYTLNDCVYSNGALGWA